MQNTHNDQAPPVAGALSLKGDEAALRDYYRDWAATFDADVAAEGYHAPAILAGWLAALCPGYGLGAPDKLAVLDAGCGTGLLGRALGRVGMTDIVGVDISQAMVNRARDIPAYGHLAGDIDLNQPLPGDLAGPFDITMAAGVFTQGHVPPAGLDHLAQVTRPGGLLIISVRDGYRAQYDLEAHLARAAEAGRYEIVARLDDAAYVGPDSADYLALRIGQ